LYILKAGVVPAADELLYVSELTNGNVVNGAVPT
jgi:hypothetical protein